MKSARSRITQHSIAEAAQIQSYANIIDAKNS